MPTKKTATLIRFEDRASTLEKARVTKMSRSAHAYVRGNTIQFYDWLLRARKGSLPDGPPVWICGDCHVGNLGPVASPPISRLPGILAPAPCIWAGSV